MKHCLLLFACLLFAFPALAEQKTTLEKRIPTNTSQRIEIDGFSGTDISFKPWDKNEVYVKLDISISSSDNDFEKKFVSSAKITESQTQSGVRLQFERIRENTDGWSLLKSIFKGHFYTKTEITGEIYVPRSNPLSTDLKYGTISLENMNGEISLNGQSNALILRNCSSIARIENDYGTILIENSGGRLDLNAASSTVTINEFNGPLKIDANYSTVTVSRASKNIVINDKSGKLDIEDIAGDVKIDADYSTITLNNVKGFADISSESATIRARSVDAIQVQANYSTVKINGVRGIPGKPIIANGQSGTLTLENATGNVQIDNPYSSIDLARINGNITIDSKSATIHAEDIDGDWISRTEYSSVRVRRITANNVNITNNSNPVSVQLKNVPSNIDIRNEYGDVSVHMPTGFSGDIDMYAEYGTVDTNFPIKHKSGRRSSYTAKVGSGNGSITIKTESANIELIEE